MGSSTVYVHIGQTKTATTTLQAFFHGNRQWLARQGVLYPKVPQGYPVVRKHRFLVEALRANGRGDVERCAEQWSHLKNEIAHSAAPKVLVSDEILWHLYQEEPDKRMEAIATMATELSDFDVKIICYLRRQDKWIESYHNQNVKTNVSETSRLGIAEFAEKYQKMGYFDYFARLSEWAKVFGAENMIVRPFERGQFDGGDVLKDFCGLLGVPDLDGAVIPTDRQVGLSNVACELSNCFNRAPGAAEYKREFLSVIREFDVGRKDMRRFLPATLAKEILVGCEEGNRKIAEHFMGQAGRGLFLESHERAEPDYPGMSVKELAEMVLQIYLAQQEQIEGLSARLGALKGAGGSAGAGADLRPRRARKARRGGEE